jgi:hypothetical protein
MLIYHAFDSIDLGYTITYRAEVCIAHRYTFHGIWILLECLCLDMQLACDI